MHVRSGHTQVADIIIASLVVDGTPVPRKIARLYLICDILHNSAAPLPMAWKFTGLRTFVSSVLLGNVTSLSRVATSSLTHSVTKIYCGQIYLPTLSCIQLLSGIVVNYSANP